MWPRHTMYSTATQKQQGLNFKRAGENAKILNVISRANRPMYFCIVQKDTLAYSLKILVI